MSTKMGRIGLVAALLLFYLLQAASATFGVGRVQAGAAAVEQPVSLPDGLWPGLSASPALTSTVFLPLISTPAFTLRPPNPLELTISLDSSRATTATVPLSGGTLTTSSAALSRAGGSLSATSGGTQFELTIPPDALLYTTTVVMTPISTVVGLSSTVQFIAGVHIEPEGLRLFNLATLTVTPSIAVPITQQVAFSSHALGQSAYLYPLERGTSQIVFKLMHFSEDVSAQGDGGPIPVQFDPNHVPVLPEDQYMQEAAQLVNQERAAEQSGQPGDPNYVQKLELLSRGYYENVLVPKLNQALDDCQNAKSLLLPAIGWSRQMQLWGFGNAFVNETSHISDVSVQTLINCWNKLKCVHWKIKSEVVRVLSMARQLQLMTNSDQYNPYSLPECPCATITSKQNWSGQMSVFYDRSASNAVEQVTIKQRANGTAQLSGPNYAGNLQGSGNVKFSDFYGGTLFSSYEGGPLVAFTPPNQGSHMILYLHSDTCTYLYWFGASVTATTNDGSQFSADAGSVVGGEHPLSDYDTVLSGGDDVQAHSGYYISVNGAQSVDYYVANSSLINVSGENGAGTAQVTWSFTPAP